MSWVEGTPLFDCFRKGGAGSPIVG
jgi:hypothetical protein